MNASRENECRCVCGQGIVLLTSWTNENPGRRFWRCSRQLKTKNPKNKHYFEWHDPPIEERSRQVINGLLKKLNKLEQEQREGMNFGDSLLDSATSLSCNGRQGKGPIRNVEIDMNTPYMFRSLASLKGIEILFFGCLLVLGIGIGKLV
ncbi:Uncharacterized protein At4g04775 [Linum perenne]